METEWSLDRDVIEDVRIACERSGRPAEEAEIRRALEGLSAEEASALQRIVRSPLAAKPLGPDALVDIVRGCPPMKAAARELGGYYELKAERDALANIARAQGDVLESVASEDADDQTEPEVPDALEAEPERPHRRNATSGRSSEQERQALMTLFAYHRDAVRVAQELGVGLSALNERIEALSLRRTIHRLLESTTDIDAFRPERLSVPRTGTTAPVVRRRSERPSQPASGEEQGETAAASASAPEPVPAADTSPVNVHGTRVYRRAPLSQNPVEAPPNLALRREYVREVRRQSKITRLAPPAPKSAPPPPKPQPRRPFSELQGSGGALVLERLLADEKANARALAARLGERFDGPASRAINESDLRALLRHHGLAAMFHEREIANTRFLIGFHQGARGKLANALQMTPDELVAYLAATGLTEEMEQTRAVRARLELSRKRMADRLVQVLTRAPYLDDLGILGVIDREVRDHIEQMFQEHGGAEAAEKVRAALGLEKNPFAKLLRRYHMTDRLAP